MPQQQTGLHDRILDTALEQAEAASWEQLQLHAVATALHITLDEIRQDFRQKDDLVEAWFDRADRAMLGADRGAGFPDRPLQERLHQVISRWLDALSPHRRLTREMLAYKLEPGHVHLQALGIMRISRTVQWFREAFARWLFDDSENGRRSKAFLDTALSRWLGSSIRSDKQSCEAEVIAEGQQPSH